MQSPSRLVSGTAALGFMLTVLPAPAVATIFGQTASPAPAAASRQIGTVKSVSGGTLTVGTDGGSMVAITLPDAVRVVQLAPGSTDLKTAQSATVSDIAEGDRVLVAGKPGEGGSFTATRVVLMKSSAIAQSNATRQQDWQKRGSGGIVASVDPVAKTLAITSGAKKITVTTTPATVFRRYAPGSVRFEEAKAGPITAIQPGDQVRVRGDKSDGGTSIAAEEVVSGAFRNLAGTVASVDAAANTVTLKDLASKKNVTVAVTPESDLRELPAEMAARFAARARTGGGGPAMAGTGRPGATSGRPGDAGARPAEAGGASNGAATEADGAHTVGYARSGAGPGDLSQVIGRLPKASLSELKPGEALMIVASGASNGTGPVTAITILSGVEPLLSAPQGASSFSISPWSMGGGEGAEGAAQ